VEGKWGLEELVENLQKYVERNPLRESDDSSNKDDIPRRHPWKRDSEREKMLFRNNGNSRPHHKPTCVYCNSSEHFSHNCTKVVDINSRRAIITRKGLYFNCTGAGHSASPCRSRGCRNCQGKQHSSICDQAPKSTVDSIQQPRVEKSMSSLMNQAGTLQDRDAQRILWWEEYRFRRVIFGATSSPYILGATLQKHVMNHKENHLTTVVQSLLEDTYVDDIQGGGNSEEEVVSFKEESTMILSEGGFSLHKWHSNVKHLNLSAQVAKGEETYAKSSVGSNQSGKTKILGTQWGEDEDTLSIDLSSCIEMVRPLTRRKMISAINSIYDILGWSAPITITAKLIFSGACLLKLHWDQVPRELQKKWEAWVNALRRQPTITIPRCVFTARHTHFEIHGFSDASKVAVCAAIYVVTYQDSLAVNQNLLVAKARVRPKGMNILHLELVAAHTAKLQNSVSKALISFPVTGYHNWVDSMTVLYWLANRREWSTFVRNRVKKIEELTYSSWKYVPTSENPSDLGT